MTLNNEHITRIAPSPTGDMHIGTARTAYFNWLIARATGGKFMLRIDDTDLERSKPEYIEVILETMKFLGLDYDSISYQSKSFQMYEGVAKLMVEKGLAFKHEGAIKMVETFDQPKGAVHLILMKSDGSPSYHFASVLDDVVMGTTWIVRGIDHEPNLERHKFIWRAVKQVYKGTYEFPPVTHLGLITQNKKKLSKRDGAASMLKYRDEGYDPGALLNFMLRMGWGPHEDNKDNAIITQARAVTMFLDKGNMRRSPSGLDMTKLEWFNKKYIRMNAFQEAAE
jgi:glutamyl/glutaminyl-tRNA synthetase